MHKTGPYNLVLLRHGESEWNRDNRFTGWTDVDLTVKGIAEAEAAGKILREHKYSFDLAFTSVLTRAVQTLDIVLLKMRLSWIPVEKHWRLNERHYGALQGFNKEEMAKREGIEQVFLWRRSYETRPPALEQGDDRFPGKDIRYQNIPTADLPHSESLKNTVERFLPYWQVRMAPTIIEGRKVLIVAHGNSLRALIKYLDKIPDDEIPKLNIPTGIPLIYKLDSALNPIEHFYLGNQDAVKEAEENAADLIRRIEKKV